MSLLTDDTAPIAAPARDRPLNVLVVDQEELALWGFSFVLRRQSWVSRCLVARDLATARHHLAAAPIDVVIADARFGEDALSALVADVRAVSRLIGLALLVGDRPGAGPLALPRIERTWPASRLVAAVKAVGLGPAAPTCTGPPAVRLSERERQVLTLVAEGATNAQIGSRICLSPHTIKQHTSSAYRKLNARNRAEAVTRARALGFIG